MGGKLEACWAFVIFRRHIKRPSPSTLLMMKMSSQKLVNSTLASQLVLATVKNIKYHWVKVLEIRGAEQPGGFLLYHAKILKQLEEVRRPCFQWSTLWVRTTSTTINTSRLSFPCCKGPSGYFGGHAEIMTWQNPAIMPTAGLALSAEMAINICVCLLIQ